MEDPRRYSEQMMKMVVEDPKRIAALKENPVKELKNLQNELDVKFPAYYNDKQLYRMAVIVLGLLALTAAFGSIFLVSNGKTTPEVLVALGSAAIGALVGLFAPAPNK